MQLIDLGVQKQRPYKGEPKKPVQEIYTTYELLDEFCIDLDEESDTHGEVLKDKPRWISERYAFYNLNSERAKSTARYLALDPTKEHDGDWSELIGIPVNIEIVINEGKGDNAGKFYENINSTSPMRKKDADKAPELVNPPKLLDRDADNALEVFLSLPQWLQETIQKGQDFEETALSAQLEEHNAKGEKEDKPKKKALKASEVEEENTPESEDEEDW